MASQSAPPKLTTLPDEILGQILFYLEPEETLLSVQLVSRQFYTLSQEALLWRHHCRTTFHYWDDRHEIQKRYTAGVEETDWQKLFIERKTTESSVKNILDEMLAEQAGRIQRANRIEAHGYDAKDTLLRACQTDDEAPDVLARRFYGNNVLDHIHRAQALKEWQSLSMQRQGRHSFITPERALACFDMFVLHEHKGDLNEVSELVGDLSKDFLRAHPNFKDQTLRQKALTIVRFLREGDWTGIEDPEHHFRDFQNNYIGAALQDPKHPSLPLISTAIYCALALHLGLDASFVNFPGHVYAITTVEDDEQMYLDPFRTAQEIPRSKLTSPFVEADLPPDVIQPFIEPSTIQTMVSRTAQNLLRSVELKPDIDDWLLGRNHAGGNAFADQGDAVYSAFWAIFMMSKSPEEGRQCIPSLVQLYDSGYPMDGTLIERYILRRPGYCDRDMAAQIREGIRIMNHTDLMPKTAKRRDVPEFKDKIRYKVGQVFRHKRERYTAVIVGWDEQCKGTEAWIRLQGVDQAAREGRHRGRHQSFYHSLVEDATSRYVAEDNIEIIEPDVPESLMGLAGRYFKRWDKENHVFVSNIEDEYPDN